MKIESKTVSVAADRERVFDYALNLNNFINLLPADRISEWESSDGYCSFKVQGTATIDLRLIESQRPERIKFQNGDRAPFPFTLEVFLTEDAGHTKAYQVMQADINPFLKMMVEKPLGNLFDYIADKLSTELSN